MKTTFKNLIKLIGVSLMLFCFTIAIYASNNYPTKKSAKTIQSTKQISKPLKLAQLDDTKIQEPERPIESWMLDNNFWKLKQNFWDIDPVEEERPVEDWMDKFSIKKQSSQIEFKNNEWMEKHSFYIL